jgi:hypothetical protein
MERIIRATREIVVVAVLEAKEVLVETEAHAVLVEEEDVRDRQELLALLAIQARRV